MFRLKLIEEIFTHVNSSFLFIANIHTRFDGKNVLKSLAPTHSSSPRRLQFHFPWKISGKLALFPVEMIKTYKTLMRWWTTRASLTHFYSQMKQFYSKRKPLLKKFKHVFHKAVERFRVANRLRARNIAYNDIVSLFTLLLLKIRMYIHDDVWTNTSYWDFFACGWKFYRFMLYGIGFRNAFWQPYCSNEGKQYAFRCTRGF